MSNDHQPAIDKIMALAIEVRSIDMLAFKLLGKVVHELSREGKSKRKRRQRKVKAYLPRSGQPVEVDAERVKEALDDQVSN